MLAGMREGSGRNSHTRDSSREAEIKRLQAKVGELIIELIHSKPSLVRQCELVSIARSTYCYLQKTKVSSISN